MRSTTTNEWKQGREGGNWSSHLERPLVFSVDLQILECRGHPRQKREECSLFLPLNVALDSRKRRMLRGNNEQRD